MTQIIKCVFVLLFAATGMGRIITGPKDTEAVVGNQLVLRCQTDIKESRNPVEWHFKANDHEAYDAIYKNRLILNGQREKMKVEANVSSGHYDLVIFNISLNNAGAYTCLDDDDQQRAEIIVFEQYPSEKICSTKPSDVILGTNQCNMEPDQIEISCKLRYHGNVKPHLEWFNGEQYISSNNNTTNGTMTSTVLLRADKLHSPTFNCRVAYENNMISIFNWKTTVSITSTSNLATVTKTECNQTQSNCSTLANLKCSSVWIDDINNTVANGSLLGLENLPSGNYACIATCSIRESHCTFVREQIAYACDANHKKMENVTLIFLHVIPALFAVPICVTVIVILRFKRHRLNKIRKVYMLPMKMGSKKPASPSRSPRVPDWETKGFQEQQNLVDTLD